MVQIFPAGQSHVRIDTVPDPKIIESRDAIVKITATAICGSDLHLYGGLMPTMQSGDVLGHEFMGEVMEVGHEAASKLKPGDRVVVPFTISCGSCFFCQNGLFSLCDTSNPNAEMARKAMGHSPAGLLSRRANHTSTLMIDHCSLGWSKRTQGRSRSHGSSSPSTDERLQVAPGPLVDGV